MIKLFQKNKVDEFDPDDFEVKARRIAIDHKELLQRYDDRTEEIIDLLKEKAAGLWESKNYFDAAMSLKTETKELKAEKANKQSEINGLKRQWGELAEYILKHGICTKPQNIKSFDEFIAFCQLIQFMDKDDIPMQKLITVMQRLQINKEEMETEYNDLYVNLRMKDWQV